MDVLMPQLGETVAEGKITKWFKSAGEQVKPGDNLFEIETDKVSMEVPSTTTGVLAEIRVPAGDVAPVGAIVAVIADGIGARSRVNRPRHHSTGRKAGRGARSGPTTATVRAACRYAPDQARSVLRGAHARPQFRPGAAVRRRHGHAAGAPARRRMPGSIFRALSGSGPHGRIVARDVADCAATVARTADRRVRRSQAPTRSRRCMRPIAYEEVPLDGMRRTIAARLTQAIQTIPHFYLTADVEIDRLIKLREEANTGAPKDKDGNPAFKLSLNDFIIRALALALQRVPAANAAWAGDRILRFKHADIGVAVALDGGLITPVIRSAETKSVSAISAEMKDLSARARDKKLKPSDYQGGSAAISNLGMYGVREFSAIINPPHATILAVGAARRQAVEKPDGGVAFASMLAVTLSCDHRVLDGAVGAELLAAFKAFVEMPVTMLV